MPEIKPPLRPVYIFKREGKRPNQGRWLECGGGRIEADGSVQFFLDRIPVGGWSGHVMLPNEAGKLPETIDRPTRPGANDGEDEADE
jgi:hypothetical protein